MQTLWDVSRRQVEVAEQSARLASLEEAFGAIAARTSISTIEEMVNAFSAAEDRNYAIISMINDLNAEIEASEVENASLRAAVTEARMRGSAGQSARDKLLNDWNQQVDTLQKRATHHDQQAEVVSKALEVLRPGVHKIFQKLGLGDTPAAEALAAAGVTDSNVLTHLGLIEARVSELLALAELATAGVPLINNTPAQSGAHNAALHEEETGESPSRRAGSPHAGLHSATPLAAIEISRVGGVGAAEGSTRGRRAVVAAPVPPSLADLEDSDEDDEATSARDPFGAHRRAGFATRAVRSTDDAGSYYARARVVWYDCARVTRALARVCVPCRRRAD